MPNYKALGLSLIHILEIADWTKPRGGYFISLDTLENCAKRTVELCDRAGVKLTPAGATYPYGIDPKDTNIRIAPSFPTVEELRTATELLCLAVKIDVYKRQVQAPPRWSWGTVLQSIHHFWTAVHSCQRCHG